MHSDPIPATSTDDARAATTVIRHSLATLAFRASKAVRGTPADFSAMRVGPGSRTPGEILAHMGDLLEWARSMADSRTVWRDQPAAQREFD